MLIRFAKTSDKIQHYLFRKKTPQYCIEGYIRTWKHRHTLKLLATIPTTNSSETHLAHPTFKLFSFETKLKEDKGGHTYTPWEKPMTLP
jgi:hypothetical protein